MDILNINFYCFWYLKQAATKPFKCAAILYWLLSAQFLFRSHDFFFNWKIGCQSTCPQDFINLAQVFLTQQNNLCESDQHSNGFVAHCMAQIEGLQCAATITLYHTTYKIQSISMWCRDHQPSMYDAFET